MARDLARPTGRFVSVTGGRIHLTDDGPRDAPAVVMLHGASGSLIDWQLGLVPALAQDRARDLRIVAVDRPGFGQSDQAPGRGWRLAEQGATIAAALRMIGIRRAVLVGHSWAGALVLDMALSRPGTVAGLVVVSGATMDWGGALSRQYALMATPGIGHAVTALAPRLIGEERKRAALDRLFAPHPVPEGYLDSGIVELALRPSTLRTNARALAELHGQIVANLPRYGEIACPVAILHGTADVIVPADIHAVPLSRTIAGSRLDLLEGHGHMPHHTARERVAAAILGVVDTAGL